MSIIKVLPAVEEFISHGYSHFINGELKQGSGEKIEVVNPATEAVFATLNAGSNEELNLAVQNAHETFHGDWRNITPTQRQTMLNRLADLVEKNSEILAHFEVLCTGKNINLARFEMAQSAEYTRYYAGWATKITGETLDLSLPSHNGQSYTALTLREPIGVIGGIIPWNFPVLVTLWKVAAAIATGCTVVIKPSEYTPLSTLYLAQLALEAGIPKGVFNVVNGRGRTTGQALVAHPLISKVSFTGSVPTGASVAATAVHSDFTRFTLELGGKNPAAFFDDLSVDEIIKGLIEGGMLHQGQICASIERAYIHESIIDEVIKQLPDALKSKLPIGDPWDEESIFGPLSNEAQYKKALAYFAKAKAEGDEIICGGEAIDRQGFYIPPTVIRTKNQSGALMCEETFSPIITLYPFSNEAEVIQLMNETPFGLTASIWTHDYSRTVRMMRQVKAGTVWINMHNGLDPAAPFGGIKSSGIGREFGSAFISEYTELKTVMMRY